MKNNDWMMSRVIGRGIFDLNESKARWGNENQAIEDLPLGESFETDEGECTKVAESLGHDFNFNYNMVWMIFELKGRFFRLDGWKSSYGYSHWNGDLLEVSRKEEVKISYE